MVRKFFFPSVLRGSILLFEILNLLILNSREVAESSRNTGPLPGGNYNTVEEALQAAMKKAADPNRKPISRLFGKHKGILGGDGVAYQRAIRDEWD